MALGFKAKYYYWVMEFTARMTSHERIVEHCEYLDKNIFSLFEPC